MKKAKYSEVDQVDVSSAQEAPKDIPPETVETDFSVVSEVVTHVSLEGASLPTDTSAVTSCGPVLSIKSKEIMSSDGDSVTASDGEEVADTHHQEKSLVIPELQEGSDHQKKGQGEDVGLLSVSSTGSPSTVEASIPSSQEMEAECSPPKERLEDVHEDHKIEPTGESNWETCNPSFFTTEHTVQSDSELFYMYFKQA